MKTLNFDETKQSQLPMVEMLINMGYRYISRKELTEERGDDTSSFILKNTARKKFMELNSYDFNGESFKFSKAQVAEVVDELDNIPLEGLIDTSKKIFGMVMPRTGGKTIKVFHDGKSVSKSFRYIDFDNPENNDFAVTVEFEASGKSNIRVDIVVFVNGIPFALIENKKSSVEVEEAISQHIRNQSPTYCPRLFAYPQLLIAANKEDLRYGTAGTPAKFYARWRERELIEEEWNHRERFGKQYEQEVAKVIAKNISADIYHSLLWDLNGSTYAYQPNPKRLVTKQDLAVYGMFRKDRLLDLAKNFVLFDGGQKKVMRYQQYFAIKKLLMRIRQTEPQQIGEKRKGGILWHTQGSGKSLSMVMFVKALIEDPEIVNPRVLIVTDRRDLDRQIRDTFLNAGLKKDIHQAKSGQDLLNKIKAKDLRVITTLVHKFHSASKQKQAGFSDLDKNIFVLIDEGHRSHEGEANLDMNQIIPNACYIAFTGTPLLRNNRSLLKFGNFIDRYTIDDALEDEIILPLIYEGRYVNLKQDKEEIDKQTSRLFEELSAKQKKEMEDLVKTKAIENNPRRISEIGYDIEQHYLEEFKDTGLKAQIVAPSKFSAVMFQRFFKNSGKINTAVVVSDESGIIPDDDEHKKEVEEYLQEIKSNYQSLSSYEKEVIDSFKHNEEGIEILIVVDKLLTGFDAPRNTVLYLTKQLRDHNLLQAIARVNRLFENGVLPKSAGYIIDYSENALNLKNAMELFGNYDPDDVKGALIDVKEKIEELQTAYGTLHDIFNGVNDDDEAYIQALADEPKRKEYIEALNKFMQVFSECMVLQDFAREFDQIGTYRDELKKFLNLRKTASLRYADDLDMSKYKLALIKIMDNNIKAEEAELLTKQISISDKEAFEEVVGELNSDKSKAEAILAQVNRKTTELMQKDPEFYKRFSDRIQKLLEEMRQKKLADIEALKQARLIEEQVMNKKDDSLPSNIESQKGADVLYRNLKEEFDKSRVSESEFGKIVLELLEVIKKHTIVDWQTNTEQNRIIKNALDDYLYDILQLKRGVEIPSDNRTLIIERAVELARENYEDFR